MKARIIVLLLLLGGTLTWFQLEQGRGTLKVAEQFFLDVLVSNARDIFLRQMPATSPDVVLVEFKEEESAEYAAWPPAPLDYIMVLKRLAEHQPEVVGIVEPLRWAGDGTQFVGELRQALLPFPSTVLGFDLATSSGEMSPDAADFASHDMPVMLDSDGDLNQAPAFTRVTLLPDKSLRIAAQLGFVNLEGSTPGKGILFAATNGKRLVPSFAAQVTGLYRHAPFASQRLRFGTGARLSLGDQHVIPLNARGAMELEKTPVIPTINALDLMTPNLDDQMSKETAALLGKGKVVILSLVSPTAHQGKEQAQAVAQALAMPTLHRADRLWDWVAAAGAVLLALWQLRYRRFGALVFGFAVSIVGMASSLVIFQATLFWWSPLAALSVSIVSTLFCFLWPAGAVEKPLAEEVQPETVA